MSILFCHGAFAEAIEEEVKTALELHHQTIETHLATKTDLAEVKAELKAEIAETKVELLKWMFIFWAGHTLTVVGIVIAVIKYLK